MEATNIECFLLYCINISLHYTVSHMKIISLNIKYSSLSLCVFLNILYFQLTPFSINVFWHYMVDDVINTREFQVLICFAKTNIFKMKKYALCANACGMNALEILIVNVIPEIIFSTPNTCECSTSMKMVLKSFSNKCLCRLSLVTLLLDVGHVA